MNEVQRRKFRQKMQSCTDKQFWEYMNVVHFGAYLSGQKHMREAMECHPKISKRMVEEVADKAKEIREDWDGMQTVEIEFSVDQLIGRERICPNCGTKIED